jgi:hypothetical protein
MKIELDLILKQTNSKFFMKMIKINSVSRTNQSFYQKEK